MPVRKRAAGEEFLDARVLGRAVEADVAVPLVDHVVVFGVEPAPALETAAEGVDHQVVVPRPVAVARRALVAPDVAALAVQHRRVALHEAADVVRLRAGERVAAPGGDGPFPAVAGFVGVPGVEVRHHVVAVAGRVVLHEAGGVERLRLRVGVRHGALHPRRIALRAVPAPVLPVDEEAPRLVEQHPGEDGGVVEVALDHALEAEPVFAEHRLGGGAPGARHVGHDQEAEPVRPVELARHLHLDVDAVAGERELLREQDLVLHEFVRRERVEAVRVVALVQRELQVEGLAVQRHVGVFGSRQFADRHLAHAEVGAHLVRLRRAGLPSARLQRADDLVEVGVLQVPELDVAQRDLHLRAHLPRREGDGRGLGAVLLAEADLEGERFLRRRPQADVRRDGLAFDVRREADRLQELVSARLQVDRLPHAARVAVSLLAVEPPARTRPRGGLVPRTQRNPLRLAPLHEVRQLELERRVAAHVLAEPDAVEPPRRVVVARADDEEDALPLPGLRHRHLAPVPADVRLVLYAGKRAPPRKRHHDEAVELRVVRVEPLLAHAGVRLVEREAPGPVEVQPLGPLPVRTRVLRQGNPGADPKGHAHGHQHCQSLHVVSFRASRSSRHACRTYRAQSTTSPSPPPAATDRVEVRNVRRPDAARPF